MPLHRIGSLLGATDELNAVSARVRRLQELQKLYCRSAPQALAQASRVKNLKAGVLVIAADNAAVAAKLKQLTPSLLASIRESENQITGMRIGVQVSGALHERQPQSRKLPLSADAIQKFEALAGELEDGALKTAIRKLARRHKRAR